MSLFRLIPPSASTFSGQVDAITITLLVLCGLITALVAFLLLFFGARYHASSPASRRQRERGRTALELTWIGLPCLLFLGIFAWAGRVFVEMHQPPEGAARIEVIAKQWMWKFQHPDGYRELDELHVPVGQPIELNMISQDVIHSFFVPGFRVKQDVVPGRYTRLWFQATRPGIYHLFCTQYCGTLHSRMTGRVLVLTAPEYARWEKPRLPAPGADAANAGPTLIARGQDLYHRACFSCHVDQGGRTAPRLEGVYGSRVRLTDGTEWLADENYLRESILSPEAKIVDGYSNLMPSFAGQLSEEELAALIAYLKALRKPEAPPPEPRLEGEAQ